MKTNDHALIEDILNEEFMQKALAECGLQNSKLADQEAFAIQLGENIMRRIVIEILAELPPIEHPVFESLVGSGKALEMNALIAKYIPNSAEFIHRHAIDEYEATKTEIHKLEQGVA